MIPELTSKKETDLWGNVVTAMVHQGQNTEGAIEAADAVVHALRSRGGYGTSANKADKAALDVAETQILDSLRALRTNHFTARGGGDVHFTATELSRMVGSDLAPNTFSKVVRKIAQTQDWVKPRTRGGRRGFVITSPSKEDTHE